MFHCKRAFIEKAQHLWRWISLRTFTQGWRGTSQPWAIKSTTPTALRHERMYIVKYIHWNNGVIPTALRRCNIRNGGCIHRNISKNNTALHHEGISIAKYIHWNTGMTTMALHSCNIYHGKYIHRNIDIKNMVLHHKRIYIAKHVHWNTGMTPMALTSTQHA